MYKDILVLGGDKRNINLANLLCEEGYNVSVFGFDDMSLFSSKAERRKNLSDGVESCDVVISGLPSTIDQITLNTPLCCEKIYFYSLFDLMKRNKIFLGAKMDDKLLHMAEVYDVQVVDYFKREELMVLNAIPTVEGALEIAMRETECTIHSSNCLVLGYGRIGKLLAKSLKSLGANVYVEARSKSDLSWIKAMGYKGINIRNVDYGIGHYDLIFNTVPHTILKSPSYSRIKPDCVLIELASSPGGFDIGEAEKHSVRVISAPGLPGKCAPGSAAVYLKDTVVNILNEL
ncbi:MAG: dipicolinate synthase subunit DpsA [Ruminococcaceae bacterium]|nr:dipicolinate synthase subunit DpsA [Oscillospiraceae bacterium]